MYCKSQTVLETVATEHESIFKELSGLGYNVLIDNWSVNIFRLKFNPSPKLVEFTTITNNAQTTDMIDKLPSDMLQYIFNNMTMQSLLALKQVSKKFRSWMRTSLFWHKYYLATKAAAISTDILTAADLIYGSYIHNGCSVNFWECINIAFTGTLLQRDLTYHSLNSFHEAFLGKLLQAFPELRAMESIFQRLTISGRLTYPLPSHKFEPVQLKFYVIGSSHVVYHLIVDFMRPDTIGVMFCQAEISRMESESDATPVAIYDWFVSSSIHDTILRIRPMVEALITTSRSTHSYCYRHLHLNKIIDCNALPTIHKEGLDLIANLFDTHSKSLWNELQLQTESFEAIKQVLEQFSTRISSASTFMMVPEYETIHHRVDRTAYNRLYQLSFDDGTVGYWNFEDSFLDGQFDSRPVKVKSGQTTVSRKKSRVKKTPHTALISLFRKVLNLVMLPVLKSLWLRNLNDPHVDWYSFDKIVNQHDHQLSMLVPWYDYYCNHWQTADSVTVSHAKPSSWPMSATVVGSALTPFLCEAVVARLRVLWTGSGSKKCSAKIDALLQAIEQYDLFPKAHVDVIKRALQ